MTEEDIKALENYSYTMSAISSATEQDMGIGNLIYKFVQAFKEQQKEIEKKDKIIDEMAKSIVHNNDIDYEICENVHEQEIECEGYSRETNQRCEKCVKQYFENKVKGE